MTFTNEAHFKAQLAFFFSITCCVRVNQNSYKKLAAKPKTYF